MSRVRVYLAGSLDGCIAGPNHEIDWLEEPVPEREGCTENGALGFHDFMAQVGAMLMGRSTYDLVAGFGPWHSGDIPVLVATNRPLEPMVPTVRSVSGDVADLLAKAKREAGDRDVYLDGGDIVRQALARDLVDELHHDEDLVAVLAEVEQAHGVGAGEAAREAGLGEEAAGAHGAHVLGAEDLDRHLALEAPVPGAVDDRGPALAEALAQLVAVEEDPPRGRGRGADDPQPGAGRGGGRAKPRGLGGHGR